MLYWALVFFIVAIVAALFGFGGIAAGAASIAQILFFVFLVLFVISLIMGLVRRGGSGTTIKLCCSTLGAGLPQCNPVLTRMAYIPCRGSMPLQRPDGQDGVGLETDNRPSTVCGPTVSRARSEVLHAA